MTFIVNSEDAGDGRLIHSDRRGRMLVSMEQREALLNAFERSGLSGVAFCRQHGLKYPTFATWVQKRKRQPAQIRSTAFAEVILEAPFCQSGESSGLRITLPDGSRIDIACRSQLSWAAELLRHLSSSRPC
jgi:hypothetical protein